MSLLLRYDLPRAGRPTWREVRSAERKKTLAYHGDNNLGFRVIRLLHYIRLSTKQFPSAYSPTVPIPDTEGALVGAFAFCLITLVLSSSVLNLFPSVNHIRGIVSTHISD